MIYPNYSNGLEQVETINLSSINFIFTALMLIGLATLVTVVIANYRFQDSKGKKELKLKRKLEQPVIAILSVAVIVISAFALTASSRIENENLADQMSKIQHNLEQNYSIVFLNDIEALPADEDTIIKVAVAPTNGSYNQYYPPYDLRMGATAYNKCYLTLEHGYYAIECLQPLNAFPIYYYDTPVASPEPGILKPEPMPNPNEPYWNEPDQGVYNDYNNMMPGGDMGMLTPEGSAAGTWDRQTYDGGTDTPMDYGNELDMMGPGSR